MEKGFEGGGGGGGGGGKVICESRMLGGERTAMSSSCREKL